MNAGPIWAARMPVTSAAATSPRASCASISSAQPVGIEPSTTSTGSNTASRSNAPDSAASSRMTAPELIPNPRRAPVPATSAATSSTSRSSDQSGPNVPLAPRPRRSGSTTVNRSASASARSRWLSPDCIAPCSTSSGGPAPNER